MKKYSMLLGAVLGFVSVMRGQAPVPFINEPLVPAATAPGGAQFTLTVNGTGFVSGSVVNWNGGGLATTFVNASQLTAVVPAADIASAGTAGVTVVNPGPGGASNVVFAPITVATTSVGFSRTDITTGDAPLTAATGDFNGDGKLDLVVSNNGSGSVSILLGKGDGTFRPRVDYAVGSAPSTVLVRDFNGDGKLDLAVRNEFSNSVSILLGNGDGSFQDALSFATGSGPARLVAGDFDGDGKLDLASTNDYDGNVSVLLGNGDGTFKPQVDYAVGSRPIPLAVGDVNGDGNLDLVAGHSISDSTLGVLLGNGDGTFQSFIAEPTIYDVESVVLADFDGDGIVDLAVFSEGAGIPGIEISLGNGDGTFRSVAKLQTSCGSNFNDCTAAAADINGDGKLDLVVRNSPANTVQVILGNGDGTFQSPVSFATGDNPEQVVVGDFNGDGRLDLVVPNFNTSFVSLFLQQSPQPAATLSASSLDFGSQVIYTASGLQTVKVTNTGGETLDISGIAFASDNFLERTDCGSSLLAGKHCSITLIFRPRSLGAQSGMVTITDNAANSPQTIAVSGVGTALTVSPTSLDFGSQAAGTTSSVLTVTVTNHLTVRAVPISKVGLQGRNSGSFAETNTCGTGVAPGASCAVSVTFTPHGKGKKTSTLYIRNSGGIDPEVVTLTGDGT